MYQGQKRRKMVVNAKNIYNIYNIGKRMRITFSLRISIFFLNRFFSRYYLEILFRNFKKYL